MNQLNKWALANTFGVIDIVLHPLFHIWVTLSPDSYERLMNLFVAGLHLEVTSFDSSISHILLGTVIEAAIFWCLGFMGASVYNYFASKKDTRAR